MNYKKIILAAGIVIVVIILFALVMEKATNPTSPVFFGGKGISLGKPNGRVTGSAPLSTLDVSQSQEVSTLTSEKKVVKTGQLQLVVQSVDWSASSIREMAEKHNGFIESSNVSDNGDAGKKGYVTIRIPVAKFNEVYEAIKGLARIVEIQDIQARDVTQEFIDLSARLKNLQASEAQYLEIMKKAQKIDDILQVQERLTQVQGQIESLQGQIKYLNNQTDFATITVQLSEEPSISTSIKDFRPALIIQAAIQSLLRSLVVAFNVLVQLIIVGIPLVLIAAIVAWILWKAVLFVNRKWF